MAEAARQAGPRGGAAARAAADGGRVRQVERHPRVDGGLRLRALLRPQVPVRKLRRPDPQRRRGARGLRRLVRPVPDVLRRRAQRRRDGGGLRRRGLLRLRKRQPLAPLACSFTNLVQREGSSAAQEEIGDPELEPGDYQGNWADPNADPALRPEGCDAPDWRDCKIINELTAMSGAHPENFVHPPPGYQEDSEFYPWVRGSVYYNASHWRVSALLAVAWLQACRRSSSSRSGGLTCRLCRRRSTTRSGPG